MILNLINEEFKIWVNNKTQYIDSRLYANGYDPLFPPVQIISNWNEETKLNNEEKLLVIGLEPHMNLNNSYQSQFRWLFNIDNENVCNENGIKSAFDNIDIITDRYRALQLDYFNQLDVFAPNVLEQRYWRGVKKYLEGYANFDNIESSSKFMGNTCIAIDIIPMHSKNHRYNFINNEYLKDLFESKVKIIGSKKALFLSSNQNYRLALENFFNTQAEDISALVGDNIPTYRIHVKSNFFNIKIYIRPQPAASIEGNTDENRACFGKFIAEDNL